MCLGVPCQIKFIQDGALPMARIDVAGAEQDICLAYLPEAKVGDYVLIQSGFAMTLLTDIEAQESLETWRELGILDENNQQIDTSAPLVAQPSFGN
ncbi:MAG: HypC/HybG/HupF family hydrogenase formation chaperone [Varibaculum sp.]|nr:HypC/HybG/HupF family hydrogenase formation chaperone [Varibaculum sp.]